MLVQMLTEIFFGALTGYITNDTAIRSLFQPGGVIEKTRDDFAREAGNLLEEQVLTRAVLEEQLAGEEVQKAIAAALEEFLSERLPEAFGEKHLGDLPDYDAATGFLTELFTEFLQEEQETILLLFKKYLPAEQLITKGQCEKLTGHLGALLLESLKQEAFFTRFYNGWMAERGSDTLEELGLGRFCDALIANAAAISRSWPKIMKEQYGEKLHSLLLETMKTLDLRPVLLELDGVMSHYTLRQYLNADAEELSMLVREMFASQKGQAFIRAVSAKLLEDMETVEVPAAALIPEGLLEELKPLLEEQIPAVMERVLDWLRENSQSVNAMLEEAMDEIAGELGGMKGMLLAQLKETVLNQALGDSSLVDLLQQTVMNEDTSKETVSALLEVLQTQLTEQKLGDLIHKLNEKQAVESVIQVVITGNMERAMERYGTAWMESLLEWKPGSLQLAERQPEIECFIAEFLLRGLDKLPVDTLLLQGGETLKQMEISQLLAGLSLNGDTLFGAAEQALVYGARYVQDLLPQYSSDSVYRPLYDGLLAMLNQNGSRWLGELTGDYKVEQLIHMAASGLMNHKEELVHVLTMEGLDRMHGQLSRLAENQIQALSSEEMLTLVQDLMGRELKPLNYLGAGMGAIAGATVGTALSTALPVTAAAGPAMMASVLAGKSAVFGAVGYTTNCAAVKGLFWPYEPLGGIEMIQGVIPKQKARFAGSMGKLVDRYVINETILNELLGKLEPELAIYALELADNKEFMGKMAAEAACRRKEIVTPLTAWLCANGEEAAHKLCERFGGMPLVFLRTSFMDGRFLEKTVLPAAESWLNRQLHSDILVGRLVSEDTFWQMANHLVTSQDIPDISQWCRTLLQSEQPINAILGEETSGAIAAETGRYLGAWMAKPQNQQKLASLAGRVLSADRIKKWLVENSTGWVDDTMESLFHMVEGAMLDLLQSRQQSITEAVQSAVLNRMGLMMQMGYAMMNGDAIVAQIVDRVLQQKLPIFLSVKSRELQTLLKACWEESIFPAVLQVPVEQSEMEAVWNTLLAQPVVHQCVTDTASRAMEEFMAVPVYQWGRFIEPEMLLGRLQVQLGFQWQRNRNEAVKGWQPFVKTIYREMAVSITVNQITQGFSGTISVQNVLQYEQFSGLLKGLQLRLQENIAVTRPEQWLEWADVTNAIDGAVHQLVCDRTVREWFTYKGEILLLRVAEAWPRILPEALRHELVLPAAKAVFAVAGAHGTTILQAMELSHLTETQLAAMDSAHLEQVVRGFAGHYLVHIENRGWMGAVFALPGMLIYLF